MCAEMSVIIVGGGLVGLTAAKALADQQISVTIVESKPPYLTWPDDSVTSQVCALNEASIHILNNLHIWENIPITQKTPLHEMIIWDCHHGGEIHFKAVDIPSSQLGCIVENRAVTKALWQSLQNHPFITTHCPSVPVNIQQFDDHIELTLQDRLILKASLIIGADGPYSWVRQQANVTTHHRPYYHDAMTAVIQAERPHQHTALQQFLPLGPIGILPLHHPQQSSIVWSTTPDHMNTLFELNREALNTAISKALDDRWGEIEIISKPTRFPLHMRHVTDYFNERIVLVGDAAHTIHPLAGLGANLGLFDVSVLTHYLQDILNHHNQPRLRQALQRYQRWCRPRNSVYLNSMRLLKDCFSDKAGLTRQIASAGLNMVNSNAWLKKQFANKAMANHDDRPPLARPTE